MPRTRDEAAFAAKQRAIVRAAEALFLERGFHQTGIAAICDAVGMSPGALYRYFPSKTEIIRAMVAEDLAEQTGYFDHLDDAPDFIEGLLDALVTTVLMVREPAYRTIALEVAAEAERDEEVGRMLDEAMAASRTRLTGLIEAAQRRGSVRAEVDASSAAHLILAMLDGGASLTMPVAALRRVLGDLLECWLGV